MQLPAWLLPYSEAYTSYLEMRKRKKYVLTPRAERILQNKLEQALEEGFDIEHMLDEANEKNWKSVFVNGSTPRLARPETHREPSQKLLGIVQGLKEHYAKKAAEKGRVA